MRYKDEKSLQVLLALSGKVTLKPDCGSDERIGLKGGSHLRSLQNYADENNPHRPVRPVKNPLDVSISKE